jgi:hypothetical protein
MQVGIHLSWDIVKHTISHISHSSPVLIQVINEALVSADQLDCGHELVRAAWLVSSEFVTKLKVKYFPVCVDMQMKCGLA